LPGIDFESCWRWRPSAVGTSPPPFAVGTAGVADSRPDEPAGQGRARRNRTGSDGGKRQTHASVSHIQSSPGLVPAPRRELEHVDDGQDERRADLPSASASFRAAYVRGASVSSQAVRRGWRRAVTGRARRRRLAPVAPMRRRPTSRGGEREDHHHPAHAESMATCSGRAPRDGYHDRGSLISDFLAESQGFGQGPDRFVLRIVRRSARAQGCGGRAHPEVPNKPQSGRASGSVRLDEGRDE
jgi:hypothetical protein